MRRKRKPVPAPAIDEGVAQAVLAIAQAGGVVLVGETGHPFAFYPPRLPDDPRGLGDPGAPGRLREVLRARRFEHISDEELLFLALDPETLATAP